VNLIDVRRVVLVPLVVAALALAGCSGGSNTDCGLDGCTVTFPRDGTTAVSVLGVSAELVGVDEGAATLLVAGQRVTVPVGGQAQAEGFTVSVQSVTENEVVVRIRP
jgi:hypothetical protein